MKEQHAKDLKRMEKLASVTGVERKAMIKAHAKEQADEERQLRALQLLTRIKARLVQGVMEVTYSSVMNQLVRNYKNSIRSMDLNEIDTLNREIHDLRAEIEKLKAMVSEAQVRLKSFLNRKHTINTRACTYP